MGQEIQVSVIIPAYNAKRTITRAVIGALDFLGDIPSEVIVVDDGSTDGTSDILRDLSYEYSSLRVAAQPNFGRSAARNRGVSLARGRWVMFLDSDDYLLAGAHQALARQLRDSDSALVIFPMAKARGDCSDTNGGASGSALRDDVTLSAADVICDMVNDDVVKDVGFVGYSYEFNSSCSRLYRRKQVLSLVARNIPDFGPFPEGLRFSEDRLLNIAYLALDRSQHVTFARCPPLYCWDLGESGTVSVARADDGASVLAFADCVGFLKSVGLISASEAELLVAREVVNQLKRTVLLDSVCLGEAEGLWGHVLANDSVRTSLRGAGRELHGIGLTGKWRFLKNLLVSGRYGVAITYCRVLQKLRVTKHALMRKGDQ